MFRNPVFFLLLVTTLFVFHNTHATAAQANTIEQAILVDINQYRQLHKLPPLKMNAHMVKEARQHSQDMAKHRLPFGHDLFMSRIKRLHQQINKSGAGAENVAYNYKDAHDVVKNWLLSPGHKRNIDGRYNLTGVGIAYDSQGKIYFTQMFLKQN